MGERARHEVVHALQRASVQVSLWEHLGAIQCPIAVLRGGQSGSMVTEEIITQYRRFSPRAEILTIEANGHELWKPDFDSYIATIGNFLARIDQASKT